MSRKQPTETARGSARREPSILERIAWYALLAVPVLVPTAVGQIPFFGLAPFTYNLFIYPKLFVLGWLVGISLIAWASGVLTGSIETRSVPLKWWLAAFLGLATLSTVFALSPTMAFFGGRYHAVGLLVMLLCGALFVLITQLVTTTQRLRALAWATVTGGVIVAAVALLQVLGVDPLAPNASELYRIARGMSLLGNPDFTGTYLVVPALLAAALALSESDAVRRAVAGVAFVLTATAIVTTLVRGSWIGLAVGLGVLGFVFARSEAKVAKPVSIGLAVGAAVVLPVLLILREPARAVRQITDFAAGETAGSGRLIYWREALSVIQRHPLLGTGPDSYRLGWFAARSLSSMRLTGIVAGVDDPHSVPLLLAATLGIPATIAAVGLVGASLYTSMRPALAKNTTPERLVFVGWWAALLALCAALTFSPGTIPATVFVLCAAAVLAAARAKPQVWPKWGSYAVCIAAIALALVGLYVSSATIAADAKLMRAQSLASKTSLAHEAGALAPWYALAREQAAFGYVDEVLRAASTGNPTASTDAADAEQQLRVLIHDNPHEYRNYTELAYLLEHAAPVLGGDSMNRALEAADRALQIYPMSPEAAYLKAAAQTSLGDPRAAVATLEPLWDIDPAYTYSGIVYAEALLAAGERAKAEAVVGELEKRFPADQDVKNVAQKVREAGAK